ncbi:DUF885 domain-containing protein [Aliiglaciecola sp. CAU 1673]|uniref:DUF885 domain-containing protein n=1 Tax=Aliiglaciecola sp. CAU 1673 TaxID=3032595 RepID=UPI0023DA89E7|nr:DUF885 domain-containing protein [Aliiglaciecola sp. CAU 1673]MDF2179159.1 DUF885 domain-containing protein [Aliiglaciecola sp. CAU 1673]
MKKTLVALALCGAFSPMLAISAENTTSPQAIVAAEQSESVKLTTLTDQYIEETLPRNPINAMFFGDNRFNHLWPNSLTETFIQEGVDIDKKYLAALKKIDKSKLQGQDIYTYDIFENNLKSNLEGSEIPFQLLPLNQFIFSPHNFFVQLGSGLSAQPFNNAQDFENFLKRAEGFVVWMDQAIINMREGIKQGVVQPKPVVKSMIPQMQAQVIDDPSQSPLMGPLNNAGEKLSAEEKAKLEKAYLALIEKRMTPAFKRMADFLQNEYLPKARESHGLAGMPGGKAWYEYMIKVNTTLPLTAEQIHQTGLNEVARIHDEMRTVAKEVGFKGSLEEFFTYLETDPKFYFESPDDVLNAYTELKEKMAPLVSKLFSTIPKADYVLRAYPEAQAKSAPGASYIPAAADGSRPGVFFANTFNLKGQPKYGTETLSIHEAVPGHHFQLSLQNEIKGLPKIRTQNFYTVYAEGWALYAESLGKDLGFFTDPYQYFGKLNAELFRAMRLVVDTGLHHKGWTREQAIAYMMDNSTMVESDVTAEVERYMVMPGQALAYKTGQLKLQELRDMAQSKLGDRFDIKHFHDLVLLDGPLPMPLLERKVQQWIDSAGGNGAAVAQ